MNWSPVPLLHVFEVRDVDWARLVMATLSILGLALALLEVCTPLYALVVRLAGEYLLQACDMREEIYCLIGSVFASLHRVLWL
jgi:hypothetical protein